MEAFPNDACFDPNVVNNDTGVDFDCVFNNVIFGVLGVFFTAEVVVDAAVAAAAAATDLVDDGVVAAVDELVVCFDVALSIFVDLAGAGAAVLASLTSCFAVGC